MSITEIKIFDILGREVETITNKIYSPGKHRFTWNAKNYATGFYLIKMKAGKFIQTRKMLLLR